MQLKLRLALAVLGLLISAIPAFAQAQAYSYSIVHPQYGAIGTFAESISRSDGVMQIDCEVHIAVRMAGFVIHREDGERHEILRGNRLVSLRSATTTNGTLLEVRGEAEGDHFVVTSPAGVVKAPADVTPSDPYLLRNLGIGMVVSLETGRVVSTRISGGEPKTIPIQGVMVATRHFVANGDRQQEVWLNDRRVPVKFLSVEDGTPIEFILTSPLRDAALAEAAPLPIGKLQPGDGDKAVFSGAQDASRR